ncbi:ribonuclease HI family protein [Halobacillus yeomjeoni]|uniref:Ribonuclease HI family protein n=1 Tax=Halobacillus yeomjeoni TaxID=311194 RepID=A0A931HTS0_9BACI|nr:ribonuclease HI family protein [Halobacillus yeomjeoni]MBH0229522.1 ribonuclease HI family protein [Halobacillus yeomjeoni]MCA0983077.1 ribonuclease HI family protein [Halobacillus yeomjeoni]
MIEVYTDAAASGDPGRSGAGIVIKRGKQMEEYSFFLGVYSNHEAEFLSVIKALELCRERYPGEILSIRTDAKIVVDTIDKNFTKNEKFIPLFEKIIELQKDFSYVFFKWIPDKQNKNADRLARQALQK